MSSPAAPQPNPGLSGNVPPSMPIRVILDQPPRRGWFGRRVLWIVLTISILANISMFGMYQAYFQSDGDIQEKWHSLSKTATDKVAIISVEGPILGEGGFVRRQIDHVLEDDHVKAIVLRVDSPGGTVTGSDYIYHHLKELAKQKQVPMVVSMGSMAASGGYYVSMAAGEKEKIIYAEPTTWTGSIGVIIPHYDVSGLLEKWDVADDSISSHPLKQMGSLTHKVTPEQREEERKILQELVDTSFAGFKKIVLDSRPKLRDNPELQSTLFTGRIFTASQAKDNGLVDELGFIEDAINRAIELAGLEPGNVRVVKFSQPKGLVDQLLVGRTPAKGPDLSALLDLAAPRAYYLCTWLPGGRANDER